MVLSHEHLLKFPLYEDQHVPGLLVQLGEHIIFPASRVNLDFIIKNQYKPLLRPIKELDITTLKREVPEKIKRELAMANENNSCQNMTASTKDLLAKHLFDIDGLIDAGLALPYNFEWKKDIESFWTTV